LLARLTVNKLAAAVVYLKAEVPKQWTNLKGFKYCVYMYDAIV
jgi:hypothetical protein